jgi:hypothetical protein
MSLGEKYSLQGLSPSADCWNPGTAAVIREQRKTFEEIATGDGCGDCDGGHDKNHLILVPCKKGTN